jgi:hypothetical protein
MNDSIMFSLMGPNNNEFALNLAVTDLLKQQITCISFLSEYTCTKIKHGKYMYMYASVLT